MMSTLVESLKRLYRKGTLTVKQIRDRVSKGTITEEEFSYITGDEF